ncbi:hypothetical protein MBLNU230_g2426t1 [Neophaeotheca triangularis]
MADNGSTAELLWQPPMKGNTPMDTYRHHVNQRFSQNLRTTKDLHRWSVTDPQNFWSDLYSHLKLTPALPPNLTDAYDPTAPISSNPPFFPGLKLNYAENALFANPDPEATALIGLREGQDLDGGAEEILSWREFRDRVRLTASALRRKGVKPGDRVAALVATSVWAMVLFHASASVGAIFTSISPELGLEGCVSRLQQVTPRILFADGDAVYKGKSVSTIEKVQKILQRLTPRPMAFIVPIESEQRILPNIQEILKAADESDALVFERVPFNAPLLICYSSGTTGAPKCIVHQHGIILQLKKISVLHNSMTPADTILQYSSTSWVVFYIMCGHFSTGARVIAYSGSPTYPSVDHLLRMAAKYRATFFGTSPRYLLELEMAKTVPKTDFDLSNLRMVYTTGATLSANQYKWFYSAFPPSVHLCNTAGGTDTATSLIAADPCGPIYSGQMQIFGLGMDVDVADPETGKSILHTGEAGEMVIRKPYPSMPCFFWGDKDGSLYRSSYFERFADVDVWAQHDWLSCDARTGGYIMHGRSDGVLNPSGIRFGSSEIYSVVEAPPFTSVLTNTLCVGRRRPQDRDEEVFLFVVPKKANEFTPALAQQLRTAIREALSPRHVPAFVLEVPDIPVTINGKKVEQAVKKVISGVDVVPSNTVANPESIEVFKQFRQLERQPRASKL